MNQKTALKFDDFTKRYRNSGQPAVDSLNLEIFEGEIFGYLGPNGAGKTTTIKTLLGLISITNGCIWLFGEKMPCPALHKYLGYLPEKISFPVYLTAIEILTYYGRLSGLTNLTINERIPQILSLVKLSEVANKKVGEYSKGMMQRLGIAQSLLHNPKILFWDEPDSGLDPLGQIEIRQVMLDLKSQGKTIFLSSHILSEMERVCDRIAIVKKGKLVVQGRVEELLSSSKSYSLKVNTVTPKLKEELTRLGTVKSTAESEIILEITDENKLSILPEIIQKSNCIMLSLTPIKRSLEDIFIEIANDKI